MKNSFKPTTDNLYCIMKTKNLHYLLIISGLLIVFLAGLSAMHKKIENIETQRSTFKYPNLGPTYTYSFDLFRW